MRVTLLFLALVVGCGSSGSSTEGAPVTPGSPPAPPGVGPVCSETAASDVEVASEDPNGYPSYAVHGCTLVYVAKSNALVSRDLATGIETTIAPPADSPRRPALSGDLVVWESHAAPATAVRVRVGAETHTITGTFAVAAEPRVAGMSVVFTAWASTVEASDSDVWIYDATAGTAKVAIGGPKQQRFADISEAYVVATDFAEDPDGTFDRNDTDLADLTVLDRKTGVVTTRSLPGKQAFPMLGEHDLVAYLDWNAIHPEPKLQAFELRGGLVTGDPSADRKIADVVNLSGEVVRPALAGTTIEWIASPDGKTLLYRAPADGSGVPARVPGLDDLVLSAPAPTTGFTVVAATSSAGHRLRAVPRSP